MDYCISVILVEIEVNYKLMEYIMNEKRDYEILMNEYILIEKECKNVR